MERVAEEVTAMAPRTLLEHRWADVAEIDRRLAKVTDELRIRRGDVAAEALLWQRIDALLDERLRLDEKHALAPQS